MNNQYLKSDVYASIVVFLVALPLCLGVALASGASPFSGIVSGIVGGIVIGFFSKSNLSVSGPAAGLTTIVAYSIFTLGSFNSFLLAVFIAGVLQILMGYLKAGLIGDFIPNAVIKGMLAAIGIILIINQLPTLVGYEGSYTKIESIIQGNKNVGLKKEIIMQWESVHIPAAVIGIFSLCWLIISEYTFIKKTIFNKLVPPPLFIVLAAMLYGLYINTFFVDFTLYEVHFIQIPKINSLNDLIGNIQTANFSGIFNSQIWIIAFTIAIVASLETLLSIEAIDKLDPDKKITPANHELIAQGIGNLCCGLIGGLPVTSVIVRSSANVQSGGKTRRSAIFHGFLLLVSVLFLDKYLNMIPKSSLAAILIFTGYKLAKIPLFTEYLKKGWDQFLPFAVTVVSIVITDLLVGIIIGLSTGLFFVFKNNFRLSVLIIKDENRYLIRFKKEVSFFNKSYIKRALSKIPAGASVLIDPTKSDFIDKDIIEIIDEFIVSSKNKNIKVYVEKSINKPEIFNDITNLKIEN